MIDREMAVKMATAIYEDAAEAGCICEPVIEIRRQGDTQVYLATMSHDDWCPLAHLEKP